MYGVSVIRDNLRRARLSRRHIPVGAVLLLCLSAVCACSRREAPKDVLSVSIPAQKWLLDSIVGDRFQVVSVIETGANPETFEPSLRQLADMERSALYFIVGNLDFEISSLDRIRENYPDMQIVDSSRGIERVHSGHAHSHAGGEEHCHGEAGDPHVWSSLPNARLMARNMYDKVVELDPVNRDYYTARYRNLDAGLAALNDSVSRELAPLRNRTFLVWHPSLSYFARDYGLRQVSVETAGKESSPAQYRDRLDKARTVNPLVFFTQAEFDSRQAQSMAAELKVPVVSISMMQENLPAQIKTIANELLKAYN